LAIASAARIALSVPLNLSGAISICKPSRIRAVKEDTSVVLVSNRGPVSFVERKDGFHLKRGAGGLAGAMGLVARRIGDRAVWIAAATSDTDRRAIATGAADGLSSRLGYPVYLLDIEPDTYSEYYDVVSNRMLWFANHCLWDEVNVRSFGDDEISAWERSYEKVNRRFCGAVQEVADPSALVLFQDYHLATAPAHLRRARPNQLIFHFTHSSFCGPEGLEALPEEVARGVVEGLLGADLLGFHVKPWVHNFFDMCEAMGFKVDRSDAVIEFDGRRTWVRTYPIPIDGPALLKRAARKPAQRWADRFEDGEQDILMVRADRAEPSKNIVRGFEAFGLLLDRRPDLKSKVRFVACLYPSRQSMPEYRDYLQAIEEIVEAVNDRHPGSIELFMENDYDRTLGALLVYDVLVVNPLMDGMNLVAKEGTALNNRDGALVLSVGAGAFEELGADSVEITDPRDVAATARALERAIDMPAHARRKRAVALKASAHSRTPEEWINAQIDDLTSIQESGKPVTGPP
jgi:trehalose 6-phosphate synthase